MSNPCLAQREQSCCQESASELCSKAIEMLNQSIDEPTKALEAEVDRADRVLVRLRDCLIDRLRQEEEHHEVNRLRKTLLKINTALSLVVAVEYPAGGIHRKMLGEAKEVLTNIQEAEFME
jgi:hypothetical protein